MASKTVKGRVLTPREIDVKVSGIRDALTNLTTGRYNYREAHKYVREGRRDPHRHDENQGMKISGGDVSDPTPLIVETQAGNRRRLGEASDKVLEALVAAEAAVAALKAVFSSADDYYVPLESYRP